MTDTTELELATIEGGGEVVRDLALQAAQVTPVLVEDNEGLAVEHRVYGWHPTRGLELVDRIEVERLSAGPRHRTGDVRVATPAALINYADRHVHPQASTLWADPASGAVTVVLNDHADLDGGNAPGWADHRATMQLVRSPEWKAWAGIDGQWQSQADLAAFLDDHQLDVIDPDGSDLMDITRTFHATEGATFKSARNDGTGEHTLVYEQQVDGRAGRDGTAQVPTDLTLQLRPWLGVDPVDVHAKFRFRVNGGALMLGVKLIRAEEVSRTAIETAAATVADDLGLLIIEGTAPAARR